MRDRARDADKATRDGTLTHGGEDARRRGREDARTRGRDDAGLTRDADAQDNRTAYVRAKARAEYEKHASAEGETLEEALRLAAAQVDNVEASAAHLTKVFSDERVHARV